MKPSAAQALVQGVVGGGGHGGLLHVCVWCRGAGRKIESYPETPGAICHIGMALELPGGPPQQESFQVVEWGGGRGLKQQRVVRGHGLLLHQRCVR